MLRRAVIIGAGGLGREVQWMLGHPELAARFAFVGFAVSDPTRTSPGQSPCHPLSLLEHADVAFMGIGAPAARRRVQEEAARLFPSIEWPAFVHPDALLDLSSALLGAGAMFAPASVGTVNVKLGRFSFVNPGCTLGHEASIGDYSVINPGACIGGGVEIGAACMIGSGARVLQYLRIGDGATVGSGAVVTKDVLPNTIVVGIPARVHAVAGAI